MTKIYYDSGADLSVLDGQRVAVVGCGNQGRSWVLNLRDLGLAVEVFLRADASRARRRPRASRPKRSRRPAGAR